jgi:hypothetical protein
MPRARISAGLPRTVAAEYEDCGWSDPEYSGRRTGAQHAARTGHMVVVVQETMTTYNRREDSANTH